MEESELRSLAAQLSRELPELIRDPDERAQAAAAVTAALAVPAGEAKGPLRDALSGRAEIRRWVRERTGIAVDGERFIDLLGDPTVLLGAYYMCPEEDYDEVLDCVPSEPPRCPTHKIPLILVEE